MDSVMLIAIVVWVFAIVGGITLVLRSRNQSKPVEEPAKKPVEKPTAAADKGPYRTQDSSEPPEKPEVSSPAKNACVGCVWMEFNGGKYSERTDPMYIGKACLHPKARTKSGFHPILGQQYEFERMTVRNKDGLCPTFKRIEK